MNSSEYPNEDQAELAHGIYLELADEIKRLVDHRLHGTDPLVEERVRDLLNDYMRYWK